jgi:hypothetical protein
LNELAATLRAATACDRFFDAESETGAALSERIGCRKQPARLDGFFDDLSHLSYPFIHPGARRLQHTGP